MNIHENSSIIAEDNPSPAARWVRGRGGRIAALSLFGVVAGGMNASCTATNERAPAASSPATSQEAPRTIPLFADLQFAQHIGDVASYDIICVYRKDKENPSIQPDNAFAYQVRAADPYGLRGFVDPDRGGRVSGSSPDCVEPPYPGPLPESSPAPGPSVSA
jgi:hypothetical protein